MGVRFPSVVTTTNLGIYPANGAQTVVFTTPPLNISLDLAQIFIFWYIVFNCGAGTTTFAASLRRGTTTGGTLINTAQNVNVTAATQVIASGFFPDTPGAVAGQQYSICLTGNATTGAASFIDGAMLAFSL